MLRLLLRKIQGGAFRVIHADGVEEQYGTGAPRFCLRIRDPQFVWRVLQAVDLGFGEAYMDGALDVDDLDALLKLALTQPPMALPEFRYRLPRPSRQTVRRQYGHVQHHYDLGNDFFSLWLDESRTYSCAYFESDDLSLEEAQRAKRRHILRKLCLQPGQTLLDIGCGWGGLIFDAARRWGVRAHGITLSRQQCEHVKGRIRELGLEDVASVALADYREAAAAGVRYDRVVSVGMFEHVGRRQLPDYMAAVARLLKPDGLSLLHSITRMREAPVAEWLARYIFPGGYIPSWRETVWLLPEYDFQLLDAENLRCHYARTLDCWTERFEASLTAVRALCSDERFIRMWRLYLRAAAAGFRWGDLSVHQFLFSQGRCEALPWTRTHVYAPG